MATLDIGFEWPVDEAGYQIEQRKPQKGPPIFYPGGEYIVRRGGRLRQQKPLEFHPTLFMDFANLDGSAESCVTFASRFGYLYADANNLPEAGARPPENKSDAESFPKFVKPKPICEPLYTWQDAIKAMHSDVSFWQQNPDTWIMRGDTELNVADLEAVLVPTPPDGRPGVRVRPASLIGAMRLQFVYAVASGSDVATCEHCGEWFASGGQGRRKDAKFCSDRCRTDWHNAKKRKAS